jgi:hypothetical protein
MTSSVSIESAAQPLDFRPGPGNVVVLDNGPYKYVRGVFLHSNDDVKWGTIRQSDGIVSSHPVEWMVAG